MIVCSRCRCHGTIYTFPLLVGRERGVERGGEQIQKDPLDLCWNCKCELRRVLELFLQGKSAVEAVVVQGSE